MGIVAARLTGASERNQRSGAWSTAHRPSSQAGAVVGTLRGGDAGRTRTGAAGKRWVTMTASLTERDLACHIDGGRQQEALVTRRGPEQGDIQLVWSQPAGDQGAA